MMTMEKNGKVVVFSSPFFFLSPWFTPNFIQKRPNSKPKASQDRNNEHSSNPVAPPHPNMRKAQGLARGRNRRKQQGSDGPAQPQQPQGPGGGGGGPANQQQQHPQHPNGGGPPDGVGNNGPMQRRKPSPEEQALTAKNYRLAKELVSLGFWHWWWGRVGIGFRRRATRQEGSSLLKLAGHGRFF